jgi:hypothetical protein
VDAFTLILIKYCIKKHLGMNQGVFDKVQITVVRMQIRGEYLLLGLNSMAA